ncbi:MAG: 2Fe-2S iron-sulfur cluster-binding protein, partial [Clostridia bacterium]|nr:2Fe-2S iron-sulfur cluster-binding protein [Clostridia bacterium]
MKQYSITVLPAQKTLSADEGTVLLHILRDAGFHPDAPCGGRGTCGKCTVMVDGQAALACRYVVDRDITVTIPETAKHHILTTGSSQHIVPDRTHRYVLAVDIGTTTVVVFLLDGRSGDQLAEASMLNPQTQYGADVISRISHAIQEGGDTLKNCIRDCLHSLTVQVCEKAGISPDEITAAAIVGNTAMHHLLLGIDPTSLTKPPYMPKVRTSMTLPAQELLPISKNGIVRILPHIAGFVGA